MIGKPGRRANTRWSAEAWLAVPSRVQAGARAAERDSARGVVQLTVTSAPADMARLASYAVPV